MTQPELAQLDNDALWQLWANDRDHGIKDELVIRYVSLVRQVAGKMRIGLPKSVEIDELVNSGIIGLVSAIDNFDLSRGFKFETYASQRIRGSILDGLRDYDWMPRSIRSKTRIIETALVELEGRLGRIPHDEEVADELGVEVEDYYQLLDDVKVASILSLDEPYLGADGEIGTLGEMVEDESALDPVTTVEWKEAKNITKRLIRELNQQERLVIALYYYEDLNLREIGEVLGISESRVSQIHNKVIITLKGKLRALFRERHGE